MKFKRFENRVWLSTPTMHDEEQQFVKEAFDTNWVAPLGPNVDEFEKKVSEYLGVKGTSAVSSGTAALHLAYKLAGIDKDDIVLVQDLTFSATINPIIYQNAIPVFIDSERETWNMDPRALEKAFEKYGDRVKAVILVHLYGVPGKVKEIKEICDRHNVILIEDAAESLTAKYEGKQTGTFGKYAALSFNGNKLITTSGGGMLVSQDAESAEKARFWSTQSKESVPYYLHKELGYNYRMSNVVAGIGRGQFLHVEEHKNLKVDIYNRYKLGFKNSPISMNPYLKNTEPSHWLSAISIDEEVFEKGLTPEKLRVYLEDLNIESRRAWNPMHLQPYFEKYDFIKVEDEAVSKDIFERGLCLPSDIKMSEENQEKVIEIINDFVVEFVG